MNEMQYTLENVYTIMENFYEKHGMTEKQYNIFEVLEITEKEVMMCRMLADILNPKGMHGQGSKYLKQFLVEVLKELDAEYICKTASVYKEFSITEERRIDIVIMSHNRFIPIEVKIDAGEQKSQCYNYYEYAKHRDKHAKVVYLTKWGDFPSEYSLSSSDERFELNHNVIQTISFSEDIVKWLTNLVEIETVPFIREILLQYKCAVESFTKYKGEILQMEVAEALVKTEKDFRSMLLIEQSASKAKALLIYKVMEEIEHQMQPVAEKYGLKREERFQYYEYKEQANEKFYAQSASTYPGINYILEKANLPNDIELWFRIEIDYALFAGFCLFDPKAEGEKETHGHELDEPSENIKSILSDYIEVSEAQYDDWWVQWWYLPTAEPDARIEAERIPNFKYMNEAAIQLADEKRRKQFVTEIVGIIKSKLDEIVG